MSRLKSYEILDEIGRGGFGVVYKARCIAPNKPWSGSEVAVKKIDISKVSDVRVRLELSTLEKMHHSNIVEFFEEFREGGAQYIVMEYCKHGSMRDYVKSRDRLSDYSAAYVLRQLVRAVKYVHSKNMMHRDLSAGNVLITMIRDLKLIVKLCDFGLATLLRQGDVAGTIVGTPGYIAPQVFDKNYSRQADVFSLGGILYLMLKGTDPPRDRTVKSLNLDGVSSEGAELIKQMMDPNENERITLDEIRTSNFMRIVLDFDVSSSSFRDPSREGIRSRSREPYPAQYPPPVRVRAQSAQPRIGSYRRITKDSAFESGDVGSAASDRRRMRTGRDSLERLRECRHSHCEEDRCRRCGMRRSLERRPEYSYSSLRVADGYDRAPTNNDDGMERRNLSRSCPFSGPRRVLSSRNTVATVSSFGPTGPPWPLNISRLAPSRLVRNSGRFLFNADNSIVFEVASKKPIDSEGGEVIAVLVVEILSPSEQTVSLYQPSVRSVVPSEEDPPLPIKRTSRKTYKSLNDIANADGKNSRIVFSFYKRVAEAVKFMGGRVEKIVFKPSRKTTARLMENGDFRLKFSDGRLAVQKGSSSTVVVTNDSGVVSKLSDEEMKMFLDSRSDILEMETLLEMATFRVINTAPFYFANTSLFAAPRGNNEDGKYLEYAPERKRADSYDSTKRRINCELTASNEPRKPLLKTDAGNKLERTSRRGPSFSDESENICPTAKDLFKPRLLTKEEYELRAQKNPSGRRILSGIVLKDSKPQRKVKISKTSKNTFIYEEGGVEIRRFHFDGSDFSMVPAPAVSLTFTLHQKLCEQSGS